jgi:hypothetical protein
MNRKAFKPQDEPRLLQFVNAHAHLFAVEGAALYTRWGRGAFLGFQEDVCPFSDGDISIVDVEPILPGIQNLYYVPLAILVSNPILSMDTNAREVLLVATQRYLPPLQIVLVCQETIDYWFVIQFAPNR